MTSNSDSLESHFDMALVYDALAIGLFIDTSDVLPSNAERTFDPVPVEEEPHSGIDFEIDTSATVCAHCHCNWRHRAVHFPE